MTDTAKIEGKTIFTKKCQINLRIPHELNISVQLLCLTVSNINAFYYFTHKFKSAAKNGEKTNFGKKCQIHLHITCRPEL